MSTPDENAPKSRTEPPPLDTAEEPPREPRTPGREAMEKALRESGKKLDDLV